MMWCSHCNCQSSLSLLMYCNSFLPTCHRLHLDLTDRCVLCEGGGGGDILKPQSSLSHREITSLCSLIVLSCKLLHNDKLQSQNRMDCRCRSCLYSIHHTYMNTHPPHMSGINYEVGNISIILKSISLLG